MLLLKNYPIWESRSSLRSPTVRRASMTVADGVATYANSRGGRGQLVTVRLARGPGLHEQAERLVDSGVVIGDLVFDKL